MLLVIGATGAIGRPLIDVLINEGAKVRVVICDPPEGRAAAQDRGPAGRFDAVWRRLDERRPRGRDADRWLR
jgi:nucleoside-diphosphate-sugar epimerase